MRDLGTISLIAVIVFLRIEVVMMVMGAHTQGLNLGVYLVALK